ncbi:3'-5' exonuclease [Methylobacterium sp. WL9]|uniref:3'-5' exonuclease n=1 Tax=Methylobacterium sp. WL9 TaxID=2603898 RepID=UPI001FED34A5|nr:3'-5' exonuclease [Methylobacterium sp. WL9]
MPFATPAHSVKPSDEPRPMAVRRPAGSPSTELPRRLLALDIETVPDDVMPADWPPDKFPKAPWHRIVAISFVEAEIRRDEETGLEEYHLAACRSGGGEGWDEGRLLRAFWKFFDEGDFRVVTWNGRSFDMPTIVARSMMHGISAAAWYRRGTKWAGYAHRYAPDWHTDLMDVMADFGATSRLTLEEAATLLGLPGKLGEHGSRVAAMVADGQTGRVRDYCETDCLNLAVLYVRFAFLTGRTGPEGHDRFVEELMAYLERERSGRPHLGRFLDGWRANFERRPPLISNGT